METTNITKMKTSIIQLLCCPVCKNRLEVLGNQLKCIDLNCERLYPIIDDVPILINEHSSLFSINEIIIKHKTEGSDLNNHKNSAKRFIPNMNKNIKARKNYYKFAELLKKQTSNPKVLVLGGGILGEGMDVLVKQYPNIDLIESDIYFGPRTKLICDAHDIPLQDNSLDGIIIQAVLEHVADPWKCIMEIYRVLKINQGIVYAETPFMQQVHMGRFDFTRFTNLGHRRLFRRFEEIDSGASCGPGMALAWAYEYFLLSFIKSKILRRFVKLFAKLSSFWLKYFDYYLINKPGAIDAASSCFFLGKKIAKFISDKELINQYKGAMKDF